MSKRGKTVTHSFRLSSDSIHELTEDAEQKSVSLNTLVNQIVNDYLVTESFRKAAKLVKISRRVLKEFLDRATQDDLKRIGKEFGSRHPSDYFTRRGILRPSLQEVLSYMKKNLAGAYWVETIQVRENPDTDSMAIFLTHEISNGWSVFLAEYLITVLLPFGYRHSQLDIQDAELTVVLTKTVADD